MIILSFACVYTQEFGLLRASQHNILNFEGGGLKFFLCSWQGLNLGLLNLESDALPIEPSPSPQPAWLLSAPLSVSTLGDGMQMPEHWGDVAQLVERRTRKIQRPKVLRTPLGQEKFVRVFPSQKLLH